MLNINKLYAFREKIPKNIRKIFPKPLRRIINQIFFRYYYLQENLKKLPDANYPDHESFEYQKKLIENFNQTNNQTSFMTYPDLMKLLLIKFDPNKNLNFLDIGGEKIDFYLNLKKNFKDLKYFLFNQKSVNRTFHQLKNEFEYKNLNIIDETEDLFKANYDFVNFGSCIQYFEDYENLLKQIIKNSKYIFFSGTHLYNSDKKEFEKSIIVKQVNLLPQIYYLYFFNRQNFFKLFTENNFTLVFEKKNLTDNVNYDNFKNYLHHIQYSDFLFVKK